MKKQLVTKIVSVLLVMATLLSVLPMNIFAETVQKATAEEVYIQSVKLARASSKEEAKQILEKEGRLPDVVMACVGGGSNAEYLNQLTALATGKTVYAGPTEATAIGNLSAQMIEEGVFADLASARQCVADSFEIQIYE